MTEVALLSDIHMRDGYVEEVGRELEAVLDRLDRRHDPAHAFVLGDSIEDGGSIESDRENVRRVRSILDDWSVPVTYLIGNHDVERLSRAALSDLLEQDSFFGVEQVGDTTFVYLDSTFRRVGGATGRLGPEQLAWMNDTLSALSDVIVLVHHPIGNFDLAGNEWFSEYPERAYLWDRKEALECFGEAGTVRATISGHIHQPGFDEFRGVPHVSVDAFSKKLPSVPLTGTYAVLDGDGHVEIGTRDGLSNVHVIG